MIKNIVLDIGNVLGHFQWELVFRDQLHLTGEDFDRVANATTRNRIWYELDRSLVPDSEILEECIKNSPQDEDVIRKFFDLLGSVVEDYDYACDWINELKAAGYKVYILSNYGKTSFTNCRKNGKLSFVELADGAVISYEIHKVKPEPEIYEELFARYNLVPEECLFFDDNEANVIGGRKAGMKAEVFVNLDDAKRIIESYR